VCQREWRRIWLGLAPYRFRKTKREVRTDMTEVMMRLHARQAWFYTGQQGSSGFFFCIEVPRFDSPLGLKHNSNP